MNRQAFSLRAVVWLLAMGPALWPSESAAQGVAVEADGSIIYVSSFGFPHPNGVLRIDPVTGAATELSTQTAGSGPAFNGVWGVTLEPTGAIVVTTGSPSGEGRLFRVDPASGARTIISDATTGTGPTFIPGAVAAAPDGSLFVANANFNDHSVGAVLRVDPVSGDRTVISSASVGTGPALDEPRGLAFDANGALLVGKLNLFADGASKILRIDPATGDRSIVSDGDTGRGRDLLAPRGLDVGPKGKIAVADSRGEPTVCVPLCPSELCAVCLFPAGALVKVDPVTGNRKRVSGGGTCVLRFDGCHSEFFGAMGDGPAISEATDIAREAGDTFVMAFMGVLGETGVMRVDPATHQRTVLFDLFGARGPNDPAEKIRDLMARHPERVYRPADAQAWLRHALGAGYASLAARPAERLFDGLSPAQQRIVASRLHAALEAALRRLSQS